MVIACTPSSIYGYPEPRRLRFSVCYDEVYLIFIDNRSSNAFTAFLPTSGSIVLNQAVTLGPCAIAHGNLSVSISSTPIISQPGPLSSGQTVVAEKANIEIRQEPGILIQLPTAPKLADVVRALNALGATPQDLLAILQAIKAAGALNAELEVI